MAASIKASNLGLRAADVARKAKGWNKHDQKWATAANVSIATLKRFWRKTAISRDSFIEICKAIDIDWNRTKDSATENLIELIQKGINCWNEWKHENSPIGYTLDHINLGEMKLQGADFSNISLRGATFSNSDLHSSSFAEADLSNANFHNADLRGANLVKAQASQTNFSGALFTGACLEDWNINSATKFDGVVCEYVYLKTNQQERRPREGIFKPGEFAALFQQVVDTVDLIFKDGIDWQAFFKSFQELRSQYIDQDLSIQAIEKKRGGAFVVRLEMAENADKTAIESSAKELYESRLKVLEAQYEKQLRLQGEQHLDEMQRLIAVERQEKATLMGVLTTMASSQQGSKYDLSGAQFAGGFVETIDGKPDDIINNYDSNAEDISHLIYGIRDQIRALPPIQKDKALNILEALEDDLNEPEPDQTHIESLLKELTEIATLITGPTSQTNIIPNTIADFTKNVIQLTEILTLPSEKL